MKQLHLLYNIYLTNDCPHSTEKIMPIICMKNLFGTKYLLEEFGLHNYQDEPLDFLN